jgi:hypothetical protein
MQGLQWGNLFRHSFVAVPVGFAAGLFQLLEKFRPFAAIEIPRRGIFIVHSKLITSFRRPIPAIEQGKGWVHGPKPANESGVVQTVNNGAL